MDDSPSLQIDINSDINISATSANFLCKYMDKADYLYEILQNMAIKPRYVEEYIDYYRVDSLVSMSIPMVCFCDIPLSKIAYHTAFYGEYGIALDKSITIKKNVQPITYINCNSSYYKDFAYAISGLLSCDKQIDSEWSYLSDFVLTQMVYSKPVSGVMFKNAEKIERNFKDECEWRYIPEIPEDMELVLFNKRNTDAGRALYNKALASDVNKNTWLSFTPDEISYLIVPNESDATDLIEYISERLECNSQTRRKLISKIEISNKIKKNFV